MESKAVRQRTKKAAASLSTEALQKMTAAELRTIKRLLPAGEVIFPPEPDTEAPFLSLIALEAFRLRLENWKKELRRNTKSKIRGTIELLEQQFVLDPHFASVLETCGDVNGPQMHLVFRRLRHELRQTVAETLRRLEPRLRAARAEYGTDFPLHGADLPEIDRDIYWCSLYTMGYGNSLSTSRYNMISIADVATEMMPYYGRHSVLPRLRATSPLFTLGLLDINFRDLKSNLWEHADIVLPPGTSKFSALVGATSQNQPQPYYEIVAPRVDLEEVVLPAWIKRDIQQLCTHDRRMRAKGFAQKLVFLFQGPPGTGKSMTARAIARELGLTLLKVNVADINAHTLPQLIALFCLRAQMGNHVLLIDECEDMISKNPFVGVSDSWSKLLFEDFQGVAVLTTNHPVPLGFSRRATYHVEFPRPNVQIRARILERELRKLESSGVIENLPSASAVAAVSENFDLPGGYYPQLLQLAAAQSPPGSITESALIRAFRHGESSVGGGPLDEVRHPKKHLDQVHLRPELRIQVGAFIDCARQIGAASLGSALHGQGATALLSGPSGTGKTLTAEAVAAALGLPFRRVSPSSFLGAYVGETERKLRDTFRQAHREKYLLFIDEAEGLFLTRDSSMRSWEITMTDELLYQVESFTGVLMIATNHAEMLDPAFARRFLFHLKFDVPDFETRLEIWKSWFKNVFLDFELLRLLAKKFELTGGEIRNIAIRGTAARIPDYDDLKALCEETLRARTGYQKGRIGL